MMIKLSYSLFAFVSCNDIGQGTLQKYSMMPCNKPEYRFVQRVNSHEGCWYSHEGCWYNSQQDHNPSFMLSNQIKWQDVPLPPLWHVSVPRNDSRRCPTINLNLVLSKESKAMKDVGTTVDKTTIPVKI